MTLRIRAFIRHVMFSHILSLSGPERMRSSLGAFVGMSLCGFLLHALPGYSHWLLAPMGGSVVILFIQSHSPLAQPWPVIGSYLVSTVSGLICTQLIAPPEIAAALAVASSLWLMARFNCIHPPGAALALLLVLDGAGTAADMARTSQLVGLNVMALLSTTWFINNKLLGRRYPYRESHQGDNRHNTSDRTPIQRIGLNHADLESAVKSLNTFVDIQETELIEIYGLAVDHAFGRHVGLTCGDIMSRDVVTVHFDTDLEVAWNQLRFHKIKSLPVVDQFKRLIGIVTVADFLRQMDDTSAAGLAVRLQGFLKRTPGIYSAKAEVVGQIMTPGVFSANPQTPIAELVRQVAEKGLPHIPVVDSGKKVVGIVTQSDMLAALYKRIALSEALHDVN